MSNEQRNTQVALKPVDRLKAVISTDSVQEQFKNALEDNSNLFIASLIDLYSGDTALQQCNPGAVIMEALKAATLKLPINKSLGFAWVIARNKSVKNPDGTWGKTKIPAFQMGWKGWVQLAMRTGKYRYINADVVYEGETAVQSRITGEISITGDPKSENAIGYFAFFETLNGFKKGIYWTRDKCHAHGKKYSPSYGNKDGAWQTSPDSMCLKTVTTSLLSKWGILSVDMEKAIASDVSDEIDEPGRMIRENANQEVIDVECEPIGKPDTKVEMQPANGEAKEAEVGPDF